MTKYLLLLALLYFTAGNLYAQNGKLSGIITDKETKDPIPFATIKVSAGGQFKGGSQADINGQYVVSPLSPGIYQVEVSIVGYTPRKIDGVVVNFETTTRFNIDLKVSNQIIGTVEVETYKVPLISKDETSTGTKLTAKDIEKLPSRSISAILTTTAGVFSNDDGGDINVRGNRGGDNIIFVNGVRQFGASLPPVETIQELSVITGGVPAQYGDALGGIISITTKGPSQKIFGSVQAETSRLFDNWNSDLLGFSLSGPLIKAGGRSALDTSSGYVPERRTVLGYFANVQYAYDREPEPSAIGYWQATDQALAEFQEKPLMPYLGLYRFSPDFWDRSKFENVDVRRATNRRSVQLTGNLDWQPAKDIDITLGGNYAYVNSLNPIPSTNRNFFNSQSDQRVGSEWNAFVRFRQSFGSGSDSSGSLFKNLYYQVQLDYYKRSSVTQDPRFKDDITQYGYFGKVIDNRSPVSAFLIADAQRPYFYIYNDQNQRTDSILINQAPNSLQQYFVQSSSMFNGVGNSLRYQSGGNIPFADTVNNYIFRNNNINTLDGLQIRNGFLNGERPLFPAGYSYSTPGAGTGGYSINNQDQFRATAQIAGDVGKHTIKIGAEYEQRTVSSYGVSSLYTRARQLTNNHLIQSNRQGTNVNVVRVDLGGGRFADTIKYDYRVLTDANGKVQGQSDFDLKLRERLGIPTNRYINTDELSPDQFSIGMFSPYELFNLGRATANWQGYSHDGKKSVGNITFNDFFSDTINRPVSAFRPNYLAFFIEDKFEINDLIIRLGVRFDRFDINQPVLKDMYSLTNLTRVGQTNFSGFATANYQKPSNVGDDWAVYVDRSPQAYDGTPQSQSQFNVLGYRDGDRWYNASGIEDPAFSQFLISGTAHPWYNGEQYRNNPNITEAKLFEETNITLDAFQDFKPQWNVSPRLAFSFPVSEDALFFAHYDILTQRPRGMLNQNIQFDNFGNPGQYYSAGLFRQADFLNNPNLKPQRKIDYQLGFQQRLSASSALKFSFFYSEIKDMIQVINVLGSFPMPRYQTNGNVDFGVIKGSTISYDLRRTGNFTVNSSYTLQFAESSASDFAGLLLNTSTPNLKNIIPSPWDQRHALKLNLDYRWNDGEGLSIGRVKVLENVGINATFFAGSGLPYTRNVGEWGGQTRIQGGINSARLPWNNRTSLRIDKTFYLAKKGKDHHVLNVYFYVQNLFNVQNILAVHPLTGSPSDDGYLSSDFGQRQLEQQTRAESFALLYNMDLMSNVEFFSLPRRSRLGLTYNF